LRFAARRRAGGAAVAHRAQRAQRRTLTPPHPTTPSPPGSLTLGHDHGSLTAPLLTRHVSYPTEAHAAAAAAALTPGSASPRPWALPSSPPRYAPPRAPDIAAGVPIAEEGTSPRTPPPPPPPGAVAVALAEADAEADAEAAAAEAVGALEVQHKGRGAGTFDAVVYGVINAIVGVGVVLQAGGKGRAAITSQLQRHLPVPIMTQRAGPPPQVPCMIAFAAVIFSVGPLKAPCCLPLCVWDQGRRTRCFHRLQQQPSRPLLVPSSP
jgi:hypothetical protein